MNRTAPLLLSIDALPVATLAYLGRQAGLTLDPAALRAAFRASAATAPIGTDWRHAWHRFAQAPRLAEPAPAPCLPVSASPRLPEPKPEPEPAPAPAPRLPEPGSLPLAALETARKLALHRLDLADTGHALLDFAGYRIALPVKLMARWFGYLAPKAQATLTAEFPFELPGVVILRAGGSELRLNGQTECVPVLPENDGLEAAATPSPSPSEGEGRGEGAPLRTAGAALAAVWRASVQKPHASFGTWAELADLPRLALHHDGTAWQLTDPTTADKAALKAKQTEAKALAKRTRENREAKELWGAIRTAQTTLLTATREHLTQQAELTALDPAAVATAAENLRFARAWWQDHRTDNHGIVHGQIPAWLSHPDTATPSPSPSEGEGRGEGAAPNSETPSANPDFPAAFAALAATYRETADALARCKSARSPLHKERTTELRRLLDRAEAICQSAAEVRLTRWLGNEVVARSIAQNWAKPEQAEGFPALYRADAVRAAVADWPARKAPLAAALVDAWNNLRTWLQLHPARHAEFGPCRERFVAATLAARSGAPTPAADQSGNQENRN